MHGMDGCTSWMTNDLGQLGISPGPNLSIDSFNHIDSSSPQLPSPALIAQAMIPERLSCKGRVGVQTVADETSSSMGVESQQEGDEQMVRVPEGLEGLCSNPVVCRGIHQEHAQKHNVASDPASLSVVNLHCRHGTKLVSFDIEEAVDCGQRIDLVKKESSYLT